MKLNKVLVKSGPGINKLNYSLGIMTLIGQPVIMHSVYLKFIL